ncbi:dephospho-CoA kinase [Roseovarius pelagicus]|uniref:Dephospho-CoA kinase n=1 Tax=Roseovarius pelagicus TaxID=2980108 RepID=A0ABY6D6V8_9RHOB|nr:dephospho-CoA kinase [Roseovarius pelagicus]UXX81877.1 dephospho-CoA kinase [Roseovarius pelagicus]
MTFRLGLTGSIGMGKSTTARMFVDEGCALWDADAAVHRLYAVGGAAVPAMTAAFPGVVVNGAVSRAAIKDLIAADPLVLSRIEQIVHPLVAADRKAFSAETVSDIAVYDIPLLFENRGESQMDATVCVTATPDIQRDRVMARGTMSEEQFQMILAKQMPDAEKRARSDYVIETDTLEHARAQVQDVVRDIRENRLNA